MAVGVAVACPDSPASCSGRSPLERCRQPTGSRWSGQRRFHEFGLTREQLSNIAINARKNAALNPKAIYRDPMTLDDYLNARMITSPLCLFDCDAPCDGSTALVVSHVDYAPDAPHPSCHVNAVGTALWGRPSWDQFDDMTTMAARDAAASMWQRTDLRPSDVDIAELYDGFSMLTMVWLEALGFCGRGESGPFVDGGTRIALDGKLPLNTAGGQLSAGRLHGFGMLHEACVQLRGEGGARQIPGRHEVAAVANGGGPIAGTMLLTRARRPLDSGSAWPAGTRELCQKGSGPTPSTPTASRRSARDGTRHPPNSTGRAAIA